MTNKYNGWKNKETWLVNIWCMDSMPHYFTDVGQFHVEPHELENAVMEVYDNMSDTASILRDFVLMCWADVDWYTLAEHLNEELDEMQEEKVA